MLKRKFLFALIGLTLACTLHAHTIYLPPQEIQCWQSKQEFYCGSLNHHYFMPTKSSAKFKGAYPISFTFLQARAVYHSATSADVFMTYINQKGESMHVKNLFRSYVPYSSDNHWYGAWYAVNNNTAHCWHHADTCPILISGDY